MRKTIGILDIETGGFSVTKNGVCEIALLIVDEELEVIVGHSILIVPYTRADDTEELVSYKEDSMAIHGITLEQLEEEGVDVVEACENILEILKAHNVRTLVSHNIPFDIPRVEHLLDRFTGYDLKKYGKYCTLQASREHLGQDSNKLEDLCKAFDIEQVEAHRGLSDCHSALGVMKVLKEKGVLTIEL